MEAKLGVWEGKLVKLQNKYKGFELAEILRDLSWRRF